MRKFRYLAPILAVTALLAACGGGSSAAKLQNGDVAVVGSTHITNADFQAMIVQAKENYQASGQAFPKVGTTAYESLKSQAMSLLVQQAEREQKAASMGVTVTDKQVATQLAKLKQQYFKGNEKKYLAQLKKQHLTDAQVRTDIRQQLLEQALYTKLTKGLTVSNSEIKSYYESNLSTYSQGESRGAQYLLIKSKSLAQSLYSQLKNANEKTWCALVKKYSGDPSTKNSCGKASFTKGQTVAAFDTVLFSSQPTGVLHAPVYDATQYKAYFLIRPTTAVKAGTTTPLKSVSATIKTSLLKTKQTNAVNAWTTDLQKNFCSGSKIQYQIGYTPSPDPCTSVTTTSATTT